MKRSPDLTFADYLTHEPDEEGRYELADGRLVTMPPSTWMHLLIAKFLVSRLDQAIEEMGKAEGWTTLQEPGQSLRPYIPQFSNVQPEEIQRLW